MALQILVLFFMLMIFSSFWLFINLKGSNEQSNRIFSLFVFNLILWNFGALMFYITPDSDPNKILFWGRYQYLIGALIPASYLYFSYIYLSQKLSLSFFTKCSIFIPIPIFIYLYFFSNLMLVDINIIDGVRTWVYGPGQIIWDIYFYFAFILSFIIFYKKYKIQRSKIVKDRIKYLNLGIIMGLSMPGTTNVIMPRFGNLEYIWLGPPLMLTWFIYVIYAMYKYHLMGIQIYIRKGILYSLLTALVIIIYIIISFLTKMAFGDMVENTSLLISMALLFTIAVLFFPLKNIIQSAIDKIFCSGSYFQVVEENILLHKEAAKSEKLVPLFSRIVNEIKKPLHALEKYSELINKNIDDENFISKIPKTIDAEITRINDLINFLADHSKPSTISARETDIHKFIDDTIDILRNNLKESNINVVKDFYDMKKINLYIDVKQLRQAFLNIISNSIDAMQNGGELIIETKLTPKYFTINFKDNGSGIQEKDINKIFDTFFTTKENHTGLGLAIANEIIVNHLGKIKVKSKFNIGTTVNIELPILTV